MSRLTRHYILSIAMTAAGLLILLPPEESWPVSAAGGLLAAIGIVFNVWAVRQTMRNVLLTAQRLEQAFRRGEFVSRNAGKPIGVRSLDAAAQGVIDASAEALSGALTRVKELEIRLKLAVAEHQHAEAVLCSISDAVLVTDPSDELVAANESAARAFNFDLAAAEHSPVDQVLRDPRMISMIREMRTIRTNGGRRVVEHSVIVGGNPRTYKVTLSNVSDGDCNSGVVAVFHDVTREREVSEMKNDFVSMVSHELRTPLASIKAYVEMLIDGEATDHQTAIEFYEVIQSESNRLGRLIDNILNISRIESGVVRFKKAPQSLTVVALQAIDVIAPQAAQKQLKLTHELAPASYRTMGDRDMLDQAMLNLLSNAVKYTPAGGSIHVRVTVDEPNRKILTRVSDTGVGIPPRDLPFVFDKFFRVEANSRMASGTGLGLSLVKHIVETVHGGQLFLESRVGKGSCFGFELDLCP